MMRKAHSKCSQVPSTHLQARYQSSNKTLSNKLILQQILIALILLKMSINYKIKRLKIEILRKTEHRLRTFQIQLLLVMELLMDQIII
jgi:hypothetical protein